MDSSPRASSGRLLSTSAQVEDIAIIQKKGQSSKTAASREGSAVKAPHTAARRSQSYAARSPLRPQGILRRRLGQRTAQSDGVCAGGLARLPRARCISCRPAQPRCCWDLLEGNLWPCSALHERYSKSSFTFSAGSCTASTFSVMDATVPWCTVPSRSCAQEASERLKCLRAGRVLHRQNCVAVRACKKRVVFPAPQAPTKRIRSPLFLCVQK